MKIQCYFCFQKTFEKQLAKHIKSEKDASTIAHKVTEFMHKNWDIEVPEYSSFANQLIKKYSNTDDLYAREKEFANNSLLKKYDYWKQIVEKSPQPLLTALKLTVIGNIIDYGAHSVPQNMDDEIMQRLKMDFAIDNSKLLIDKLKNASNILYIGDNAGEIVFDKLFLDIAQLQNVTFVVRNSPVLNDVTKQEAIETGIDKHARIVVNGYEGPTTILRKCSNEVQQLFKNADIVVSKGQGNFEGLMNESRDNLFFLLMAKCNIIASIFGVKKGDLIVATNNKQ